MVTEDDLAHGSLYPSLTRVREISHLVAVNIIKLALKTGQAQIEAPADIEKFVTDNMYTPDYE